MNSYAFYECWYSQLRGWYIGTYWRWQPTPGDLVEAADLMTWTEKRIRLVKQGTGVEENGTARPAPFLHITCPYHSISFPGIYLRFRFRCPLNSFISYPMYKQLSVNLATIANTKQDLLKLDSYRVADHTVLRYIRRDGPVELSHDTRVEHARRVLLQPSRSCSETDQGKQGSHPHASRYSQCLLWVRIYICSIRLPTESGQLLSSTKLCVFALPCVTYSHHTNLSIISYVQFAFYFSVLMCLPIAAVCFSLTSSWIPVEISVRTFVGNPLVKG